MKFLKKAGLALLSLVALVLLVALFVPKAMHAEKEVVINKPKDDVFAYVKQLKNQNEYSKWGSMDPSMKKEFRGTDGNVGFVSAWDSEKSDVGKGEQEITGIREGERIDYQIRFLKPWESTATSYMITQAADDDHTKVTWGFDGKMTYPFNIMNLFMGDMLGDDFSTGLNNLKKKLEN